MLCKYEQGCKPQEKASLILSGICSFYTDLYLGLEVSARFVSWPGLFCLVGWFVFCFAFLFVGFFFVFWLGCNSS